MAARRAIVVGGGIAGLATAIALRKADYDVTVLEQEPTLLPLGAALSLWSNAMAALAWLGADAQVNDHAAPILALSACDQRGRRILHIDMGRATPPESPKPRLPTRSLLQSALAAAASGIEIRLGAATCRVEQASGSATVELADGTRDVADLVVVADGIGSETAAAVIGTTPRYTGYGGVLALGDAVIGDPAPSPQLNGHGAEYWGRGERFGLFDLGCGRLYWFFMCNEASPAESHALTLADIKRRMPDWPMPVARAIGATPPERLIPFAVHAKPPPKRLGQGRIICVGDAAHAMEPNLGQGGCQSLEDAVALGIAAQCRPPDMILPLFEAMRLRRIRQFVHLSRSAGFLGQSRKHTLVGAGRMMARLLPQRLNEWRVGNLHRLPDYAALAAK